MDRRPKNFRKFTVAAGALNDARRLGMGGTDEELAEDLAHMAKFAAPVSRQMGRSRYEELVFHTKNGVVERVFSFSEEDRGEAVVVRVNHRRASNKPRVFNV